MIIKIIWSKFIEAKQHQISLCSPWYSRLICTSTLPTSLGVSWWKNSWEKIKSSILEKAYALPYVIKEFWNIEDQNFCGLVKFNLIWSNVLELDSNMGSLTRWSSIDLLILGSKQKAVWNQESFVLIGRERVYIIYINNIVIWKGYTDVGWL